MKVYLAAPFGGIEDPVKRNNAEKAEYSLKSHGFEVYAPWKMTIPHAWDYPNNEWGALVFANDIHALDEADLVVMLSYGRQSTAGTNWEAGYAFAKGKKIIVVEMTDEIMSLIVANGRYATVKGISGLDHYDWDTMPKCRTDTEQK